MRRVVLAGVLVLSFGTASWADSEEPSGGEPAAVGASVAEKAAPEAPPAEPPTATPVSTEATEVAPLAPAEPARPAGRDLAIKALGARFRGERVARAEAEGRAAAFMQALTDANQKTANLERKLEEQNSQLAAAAANQQKASEAESRAVAQNAVVHRALINANSRMLVMFAVIGAALVLTALVLVFIVVWQRKILALVVEKGDAEVAEAAEHNLRSESAELRDTLNRLIGANQQIKDLHAQLGATQDELRRLKAERVARSQPSGERPIQATATDVKPPAPPATQGVITASSGSRPKSHATLPGMVPRKGV